MNILYIIGIYTLSADNLFKYAFLPATLLLKSLNGIRDPDFSFSRVLGVSKGNLFIFYLNKLPVPTALMRTICELSN